jgi:branched-chain amino acid transport system substrate-binding protein
VSKRETVPYGTNEWGAILTRIRRIKPALIHIEIPNAQENITFFRQSIKKPTNSILSLGWGITPREVVDNLGKDADGIVGEKWLTDYQMALALDIIGESISLQVL